MTEQSASSNVRRAEPDDADDIAALVNRVYDIEQRGIDDDADRVDADKIHELARDGYFLVVDKTGGGVGATIYVRIQQGRGYFGLLSVDPALRTLGVGRFLVAVAKDQCFTEGYSVPAIGS